MVSSYLVILHAFLYTNLSSYPLNPNKLLASTATFGSEFFVSTTSCMENISFCLFWAWLLLVHLMTFIEVLPQNKQSLPTFWLLLLPSRIHSYPTNRYLLFFRLRSFSPIDCSSRGSHSAQHFYLSLNYSKFCCVWDEQSRTACAIQGSGEYGWSINHLFFPFLLGSQYNPFTSHSGNTIFPMLEAAQSS